MAGEEAVDETDVVANENPKTQAENAGAEDEAAIEPGKTMAGERKRKGHRGGDEHHAGDGADAEDEQIEQRPLGTANRAQDQQSDGGGACKAVDDADEQGAQSVEEAEVREQVAQPIRGDEAVGVMLLRSRMRMPVKMQVMTMLMDVGMRSRDARMAG